jgi:diguanylate cyclase (GGDEF)-like protein
VDPYALIAEFDRQRAEMYRAVVKGQHLDPCIVHDGKSAERVLETRGAPALLLCDLSLPYKDGFSLIRELRRMSPPEKTAVVVCSGLADFRETARTLQDTLGIAEIADKNISADGLAKLVARALRGLVRNDTDSQTDPESDRLLRTLLSQIADTLRIPVVLLSIELRGHRRLMAFVADPLNPSSMETPAAVRDVASVPLVTSDGRSVGLLSLLDVEALDLTTERLDVLAEAAGRVADAVDRQYHANLAGEERPGNTRSEEHWAALERLALTDPLTGLSNRRAGERALERETARARRALSPFSVALLDLDDFKEINDLHGHAVGDDVLVRVSQVLTSSFRASDLAVRWGGDEFLILLPDVTLEGAVVFAERARMRVEALIFPDRGRLTMSAGIVQLSLHEDPYTAIARADSELYEAKRSGRNRVSSASR